MEFPQTDEAKDPATSGPTFKDRVEHFWEWYASRAAYFFQKIEEGKCGDLAAPVSQMMDQYLPDFAWEFGPGKDGGHSFTLSGGVRPLQILANYWSDQAPDLEGWTFYSSKQPGNLSRGIVLGEYRFEAAELWVTPVVDEQDEIVDLTVWHPSFEQLKRNERLRVTYIWLDRAIGEMAVSRYIGRITMDNGALRGAIPMSELPDFIEQLKVEHEWARKPWWGVIYKPNEPSDRGLREDIVIGSTECYLPVNRYRKAGGPAEDDPVAGLGAEFLFLAFDLRTLPGEKVVEERRVYSDAVEEKLKAAKSGEVIGGATGQMNAYIDLLIYDGERSIELMREALSGMDLPYGASLHPFFTSRDPTPILI